MPPDGDHRPIPAGAYNVAAQLLAVEAGVDHHAPTARVHLADGIRITLRAARLGQTGAPDDIAVTVERTPPEERLELLSRAYGLTTREAELLAQLATGADTRQTAETLFLSEHTIQDHLKAIVAKTGAPNRRLLLARASGR